MHVGGMQRIHKRPDFTTCKINIHEHVILSHRATRLSQKLRMSLLKQSVQEMSLNWTEKENTLMNETVFR